jgi:hypothetical protein
MAHWAEIDNDNIVVRVTVGNNDDADEGHQWLVDNLGGTWLKTSYNTSNGVHVNGGTQFRGNFAATGYTYDENLDAFIPPKPYNSWLLDEAIYNWVAPVPHPGGKKKYFWDESQGDWVEVPDEVS